MTTAETTTTVTFIHKHPDQVLILRPRFAIRDAMGRQTGQDPGASVEFESHHVTIGTNRKGETTANGRVVHGFSFDKLCEELELHDHYGRLLWRDGDAPDEPKPTIPTLKEEIQAAVAQRDVDYLRELKQHEESSHNRSIALELLDQAIGFVDVPVGEPEREPTVAGATD